MAITLLSSPESYSSLHNELYFVASSTNTAEGSFKYVFDILIGGNIVSRTKIFPDPNSGYGIFNASQIVRAYAENNFKPNTGNILVQSDDSIKVDFQLQIREEYIIGSNLVTSGVLYNGSFNGYNYYQPLFNDILADKNDDFLNLSSYYDNLLIANFTDNFLTERDTDNIGMEFGDNLFISYLKINGTSFTGHIEKVNSAGVVIDNKTFTLALTGQFNLFNLQAEHINTSIGSTFITESDAGFNFFISSGDSESRKIKVRFKCNPKFRQYNLHFINRLGGWDTMRFDLANKRSTKFARSSYRKSPYVLSGTSMTAFDAYNKYNESNVNYAIQHTDSYHMVSDWVNIQDYQWLAQLVASPIVYIEVNGAYFPVLIQADNYEYKVKNADKLFNFEIDIQISKYTTSQFR